MAAAGVALGGTTLTYDSLLQSSEGWELSVGRSGRNTIQIANGQLPALPLTGTGRCRHHAEMKVSCWQMNRIHLHFLLILPLMELQTLPPWYRL